MKAARFDEEQGASKPSSQTEWLMMRHGDPPSTETDHVAIVQDTFALLSEQDQYILNALYTEQITYQELGDRLGVSKPHAWRLAQRAVADLKQLLEHNPTLKERYGMNATWQDACTDSLATLLWGKRSDIEPLAGDVIQQLRSQIVNQFNLEDDHLYGIVNLAHAAWLRLWEEGFTPSVDGICSLLARKQRDYGHDNIMSFGQRGIIVRLADKLARLANLDRFDIDPSNESLIDTLIDIVGYCAISRMLSLETFTLELGPM